ncbi:MAG TPA: glycosyltransferase, partial [Terriglobales bacterium]
MNVLVLTHSPSPYQVEYFNEIARQGEIRLTVAYLFERDPSRRWASMKLSHDAVTLDVPPKVRALAAWIDRADLAIFNYYNHPIADWAIRHRVGIGKPWVFWGERPGFHCPAWVGWAIRRWKLRQLYSSSTPIWGIGRFAIEGYQKEFGGDRPYYDIPYFSNLDRFKPPSRADTGRRPRTILYSGSLTARKGVDLLIDAFARVARDVTDVRLRIMGYGELGPKLRKRLCTFSERVETMGFRDWDNLPAAYH